MGEHLQTITEHQNGVGNGREFGVVATAVIVSIAENIADTGKALRYTI